MNSVKGLISVIVPVYNVEKYLDKCVQSIVNQTYENLEIILVDDGSTDHCPALCDEWAKMDSRIQVIHKKNGGLSSARNTAIDIISGEYVIFVDSDDWIDLDMIATMLEFAKANDADIVSGGFYFESTDGTSFVQTFSKRLYIDGEIAQNLLLDSIRPEVCSKLYRSELVKQFRFDETIKYAEDLPYNFYLMLKAKKLFSTGIPCYHYLQNSGNSITTPYITDARATSWKMFYDIFNKCQENRDLKAAAIYRFTVYIFAVLSRVTNVKKFRKKYFNEISNAVLQYKQGILNNPFISKKHKTAVKILSFSKNAFKFIWLLLAFLSKSLKAGKSAVAYIVFGLQTLVYAIRICLCRIRNKKNFIFLMLTPCHENYGDHAIAQAEKELLKDKFIYEITGDMIARFSNYPALFRMMLGKSTLVFQGGGYLGTFWFNYGEKLLRNVMKIAVDNKIVVMPQSIYYENSDWGKEQLELSKKLYAACKDLTLAARDKTSYDLMKTYYPDLNIFLIPDVVLFLNECRPSRRNGAMLTFRNDLEKGISFSLQNKIEKYAEDRFSETRKIDMFADHRIDPKRRNEELSIQFERFRNSEIVFTDRLHGMIFAAITGTPCIVLPNKSHKVKGVYDWLFTDCEYITFMQEFDWKKIQSFIDTVCSKTYTYDNAYLMPYYDKLLDLINGAENIE